MCYRETLPFDCPISSILQMSATTKDLVLHGPPVCAGRLTPVWVDSWNTAKQPGSGSQVCSPGKSERQGTSPHHLSSCSHTNTSPALKPRPFPAPYEKITTVPKVVFFFFVFLKKSQKVFDGLCCWTMMLAVSVYKLI